MIDLLPFIAPAIMAVLFLNVREGVEAKRTPIGATYPRASRGGNNPASQRVHEGGGHRFWLLLVVLPVALALAFALDSVAAAPAQLGWWALSFHLTKGWIDIAEHGAEMMHGDDAQARGVLHPDALAWMRKAGHKTYSDGEAWRMTQKGQQYAHLKPAEFKARTASRRWESRLILALGRA